MSAFEPPGAFTAPHHAAPRSARPDARPDIVASADSCARPDRLAGIQARVIVDGKVVATLWDSGIAMLTTEAGRQLEDSGAFDIDPAADPVTGPALAQRRADAIAKALGGKVETAPDALGQDEWARAAHSVVSAIRPPEEMARLRATTAQVVARLAAYPLMPATDQAADGAAHAR